VDRSYTAGDHEFRENDSYAAAKYEITLRWLGAGAGRELVNVGCGGGIFNHLAVAAGFEVRAFEPDQAVYVHAAQSAPAGCTVADLGLFEIPLDVTGDAVVMHDVLEHIENEGDAVHRLARIVRPGGVAVISVPALPSLFGYHDEQLGHYRRYTRRSLRAALEPAFEIDHLRAFGMSFIPVTAYFSRWRRRSYPTGTAGSGGLIGRAFARACRLEAKVPAPIGTSLIAQLRPRAGPPTPKARAPRVGQ
jgi:2-polyprenyl-3-methyl-5-hydroxy-6-metoxy-1,4-benzoquinol methylase